MSCQKNSKDEIQDIKKIFYNEGLDVDAECNIKIANYLVATLNLNSSIYTV